MVANSPLVSGMVGISASLEVFCDEGLNVRTERPLRGLRLSLRAVEKLLADTYRALDALGFGFCFISLW